ncbi:uncharacterized protein PAC_19410 [Phialocephala subalpina]|uniref:6-methylsalicylate decarboxylase n=1 Tax=Phialocephala subalpina TaxID=576137 RepID=A0A1L7XWY2_9HELO|nr:uncharacterized protein PAC_19410 [Phialocephala subalpina]
MPFESRIDTHAHFIPPFYRTACKDSGNGRPDGMPAIPVSTLVMLKPVKNLLDNATILLAILQNAGQRSFALETNHHGTYLGDPAFNDVFTELNRRKARVFIHPTTPCTKHPGSHSQSAVTMLPQFPNPMFEFMFDTARALINLFLSGTIERCPDITFVIPHAGGALPPVIQRFCSFATDILGSEVDINLQVVRETFKRQFYFDLAGFPFPDQIHGLLRFSPPEKLLYGSDYPFTPAKGVGILAQKMEAGLEETFSDALVRTAIYSGNAMRLLNINQ